MPTGPSDYVEVELPSGEVILANVATVGVTDVALRDRFRLDDVRAAIGELSQWAIESVKARLPQPPDKIGIEFGVKLAVKSGKLTSVLAEAGGEASFVVKLEWTQESGSTVS